MTLHLGLWSTLIFVHGISFVVSVLLLYVDISCLEIMCWKVYSVSTEWSWYHGWRSVTLMYMDFFPFHWSTCPSVCLYHSFNYCNFVVIFEIGNISYPIVLPCSNLFWLFIVVLNFPMNLKDEYVNFYKEGICDSDWDCNECIDEIS